MGTWRLIYGGDLWYHLIARRFVAPEPSQCLLELVDPGYHFVRCDGIPGALLPCLLLFQRKLVAQLSAFNLALARLVLAVLQAALFFPVREKIMVASQALQRGLANGLPMLCSANNA